MKKWLWAIPVCLILVTSVAIGILNTRDINPEDMSAKADLKELAPISEAEALTAIETDPRFASSQFEILYEDEVSTLYVTKSAPREAEPSALNRRVYTRDLGNGWTYVFEYLCGLTFTNQYEAQLERELGELGSVTFYLREKSACADPGTKSKSDWTVQAHVTLPSGEERIAFFDPKTKVLMGFGS